MFIGQNRLRRDLGVGHEAAHGNGADAFRLLVRVDGYDAVRRLRPGNIDRAYGGFAEGASHERHVQGAGRVEIVHIVGEALNETRIVSSLDGRADEFGGLGHLLSPHLSRRR